MELFDLKAKLQFLNENHLFFKFNIMSEFSRLNRLVKALVPNFSKSRERYYSFDEARMMIADLGMAIPPEMLAKLLDTDALLDEFINSLYQLEDEIGKGSIVTESSTIMADYQPSVHVEDNKIAFSVTYKKLFQTHQTVFVEYSL
jgi:hypothetical protein